MLIRQEGQNKKSSIVTLKPADPIRKAMESITRQGRITTVIVVNDDQKVIGTVTDGDIRRGLLKDFTISDTVDKIMNKNPIVVPSSMPKKNVLSLMRVNAIFHIPVVDDDGRLVGVEERVDDHLASAQEMTAVIMAGGEGQRLRPLTETVPKPMLKVCGKPILEILINCLKECGFQKVIINLGYLGHVIEDYFKDGGKFGMKIEYVREPERLGTAGALGLMSESMLPKEAFLVINGDLLTNLNFRMFREFHINGDYIFTMCGRPHKVKIPYGYPVVDGDLVKDLQEKPSFTYLVNSGIYCLSPQLLEYVPKNKFFNMTELIERCLKEDKRVGLFPLGEKFHEIGQMQSYQEADAFYKEVFVKGREAA